ncbi:sugar phosphate isomerase/epimerase [Mitsuokella jalaludinii]|uniref:sugar phosphate isomerase/epimerase family protein n=2 Tax=Mitsuokella jalaludinii TaxID=187979 RepID=UPI0025988A92|nr:sugar phosphate isomerase/epimerase [uncultured Mitsuokella sp.]
MKLSMNEATALKCKGTTLEQDLALCEKYGYDMIEIRTMDCLKNYLAVHSIDELAEYFATHPVKPWAFNTLEYFNNLPDDDYKETLRKLREMCEWGKKIGCKTVITVPTVGLKKVTRQAIRKSTLECLKEMGEICGEADMRLSVEFLGHPEASINDFGEAYDIIQELDMENVGLTLDCFHFHGMHSSLADLAQADGKKIFIVHLNDTEDFQYGALRDDDRVWPGDGCIDLDGILQTLKKIGWAQDVLSLELFRPEYYAMPADDVYRIGKAKSEAVIARNF